MERRADGHEAVDAFSRDLESAARESGMSVDALLEEIDKEVFASEFPTPFCLSPGEVARYAIDGNSLGPQATEHLSQCPHCSSLAARARPSEAIAARLSELSTEVAEVHQPESATSEPMPPELLELIEAFQMSGGNAKSALASAIELMRKASADGVQDASPLAAICQWVNIDDLRCIPGAFDDDVFNQVMGQLLAWRRTALASSETRAAAERFLCGYRNGSRSRVLPGDIQRTYDELGVGIMRDLNRINQMLDMPRMIDGIT